MSRGEFLDKVSALGATLEYNRCAEKALYGKEGDYLDKVDFLGLTFEENTCKGRLFPLTPQSPEPPASQTWGKGYLNNSIYWGDSYYHSWWGFELRRP